MQGKYSIYTIEWYEAGADDGEEGLQELGLGQLANKTKRNSLDKLVRVLQVHSKRIAKHIIIIWHGNISL